MSTLVSDPVRLVARAWEDSCGYSSAVLSGIQPDARHKIRGGYHCSIDDLFLFDNGDDYSNMRPDDRGWNPHYGAAIDMSMSRSDMIKCHGRIRSVWLDKSDPRRRFINCINCWDGSGDAVRIDFVTGKETRASSDHTWHNHGEFRRRWVLSMIAALAWISMLRGESKAQWITAHPEDAPPRPRDRWPLLGKRILREGMAGADVGQLQYALTLHGIKVRRDNPASRAQFGPDTKRAVIAFQRARRITADGIVGPDTVAQLKGR